MLRLGNKNHKCLKDYNSTLEHCINLQRIIPNNTVFDLKPEANILSLLFLLFMVCEFKTYWTTE